MNTKLEHERMELWSKFAQSGRISDYLDYRRAAASNTAPQDQQ